MSYLRFDGQYICTEEHHTCADWVTCAECKQDFCASCEDACPAAEMEHKTVTGKETALETFLKECGPPITCAQCEVHGSGMTSNELYYCTLSDEFLCKPCLLRAFEANWKHDHDS